MKAKFRTLQKILSVFLCILMVVGFMPYYAVQNKAQAVTASSPVFYWHNLRSARVPQSILPNEVGSTAYYTKEDSTLRLSFSNVATPTTGSWSDTGSYDNKTNGSAGDLGTRNFTVTAYYDYRDGATNYNPSWTMQDYHTCDWFTVNGNNSSDGHNLWLKNETIWLDRPGAVAVGATTGTKTTGSKTYSGSFGYGGNGRNWNLISITSQFNYTFNIYWTYYGCNTKPPVLPPKTGKSTPKYPVKQWSLFSSPSAPAKEKSPKTLINKGLTGFFTFLCFIRIVNKVYQNISQLPPKLTHTAAEAKKSG